MGLGAFTSEAAASCFLFDNIQNADFSLMDIYSLLHGPSGNEFAILMAKLRNNNFKNRVCITIFYRTPLILNVPNVFS